MPLATPGAKTSASRKARNRAFFRAVMAQDFDALRQAVVTEPTILQEARGLRPQPTAT